MVKSEESNTEDKRPAARYSVSGGLVQLLNRLNVSIAVTSYQSGRLYLLGRDPNGGLMVNEQFFQKAMGLHYDGNALIMATLAHIYRMENILADDQIIDNQFTDCFVPRTGHLTGILDAHDVGVTSSGEILFVNTSHNCIAGISETHSFKLWKPDFVSALVKEDRYHLNGMAMLDGKAKFVTAVSKSDTIDGWRDRRSDGGIVIDVEKNEIVCEGLSMPHSPRLHKEKLWVLNSGTGELGWIDRSKPDLSDRFVPRFFKGIDVTPQEALAVNTMIPKLTGNLKSIVTGPRRLGKWQYADRFNSAFLNAGWCRNPVRSGNTENLPNLAYQTKDALFHDPDTAFDIQAMERVDKKFFHKWSLVRKFDKALMRKTAIFHPNQFGHAVIADNYNFIMNEKITDR